MRIFRIARIAISVNRRKHPDPLSLYKNPAKLTKLADYQSYGN